MITILLPPDIASYVTEGTYRAKYFSEGDQMRQIDITLSKKICADITFIEDSIPSSKKIRSKGTNRVAKSIIDGRLKHWMEEKRRKGCSLSFLARYYGIGSRTTWRRFEQACNEDTPFPVWFQKKIYLIIRSEGQE